MAACCTVCLGNLRPAVDLVLPKLCCQVKLALVAVRMQIALFADHCSPLGLLRLLLPGSCLVGHAWGGGCHADCSGSCTG